MSMSYKIDLNMRAGAFVIKDIKNTGSYELYFEPLSRDSCDLCPGKNHVFLPIRSRNNDLLGELIFQRIADRVFGLVAVKQPIKPHVKQSLLNWIAILFSKAKENLLGVIKRVS